MSTILNQPMRYKYGSSNLANPKDLHFIIVTIFEFIITLPNRLVNPKKFKINKLKKELIKQKKIISDEIIRIELNILELENKIGEETMLYKNELNVIRLAQKELIKIDDDYKNDPENISYKFYSQSKYRYLNKLKRELSSYFRNIEMYNDDKNYYNNLKA